MFCILQLKTTRIKFQRNSNSFYHINSLSFGGLRKKRQLSQLLRKRKINLLKGEVIIQQHLDHIHIMQLFFKFLICDQKSQQEQGDSPPQAALLKKEDLGCHGPQILHAFQVVGLDTLLTEPADQALNKTRGQVSWTFEEEATQKEKKL
ncbi:hypothetical protein pb186bvf_000921 [Paramecium bursaria]